MPLEAHLAGLESEDGSADDVRDDGGGSRNERNNQPVGRVNDKGVPGLRQRSQRRWDVELVGVGAGAVKQKVCLVADVGVGGVGGCGDNVSGGLVPPPAEKRGGAHTASGGDDSGRVVDLSPVHFTGAAANVFESGFGFVARH